MALFFLVGPAWADVVPWNTVVPLPVNEVSGGTSWSVPQQITVSWGPVGIAERQSLADRLDRLWAPVGRNWKAIAPRHVAQLRFVPGPNGEAYRLTVDASGVTVAASEPAGRFYALVTLSQVLPPQARSVEAVVVAGGSLVDAPAYPWRGLMVDSSRHFQSVATLEGILELMALHKLNRFHWHLTDDQGWRLEVPSWPKLTSVGAWRLEAGNPYGGYYTAADVRRVVAFATLRHIEVIPEVDVPGHASAVLAAYPELSASGKPRPVPTDWAVADGVLSVGRPAVKRFTADVLAVLVDLFPGAYIHWGGTKCSVIRSCKTSRARRGCGR